MISEAEMRSAAIRGLESQIRDSLRETRWGPGMELNALMGRVIAERKSSLDAAFIQAMTTAIASPEFVATARAEIIKAMTNKMAGSFDAVMRAAGKKMAQDELAMQRATELVSAVMGAAPSAGERP